MRRGTYATQLESLRLRRNPPFTGSPESPDRSAARETWHSDAQAKILALSEPPNALIAQRAASDFAGIIAQRGADDLLALGAFVPGEASADERVELSQIGSRGRLDDRVDALAKVGAG